MSFTPSPNSLGGPIPLHSPALNEIIPQRNITEDVLRCIGCILGRTEEGATINRADIRTCIALERSAVTNIPNVIDDLKAANVLEPFIPDSFPKLLGKRNPQRTTHLRPTEFGATLLGAAAEPDCPARNPLISLTDEQARVVRCMKCMLARTAQAEGATAGIVSAPQMARCLGRSVDNLDKDLKNILETGLLERTTLPKKRWWGAANPYFYTPTTEGAEWLTPTLSDTCPSIELDSPLLAGASPLQIKMLGCVACLHKSRTPDDPENLLRPITVSECQSIDRNSVRSLFNALERRGELTTVPVPDESKPNSKRPVHRYYLTDEGMKLMRAIRVTAECPSGRIQPIRRAEVTRIADDGLDKRSAVEIINELPTQTFETGTEFLAYLATTYCGSDPLINIVTKALTNASQRKSQKYPGQVEDVVQNVIIEIGKSKKEITFPKEMPLLYTIVNRRMIDIQRTRDRESNRVRSFDVEEDRTIDTLGVPFSENEIITEIDSAQHSLLRTVLQNRELTPIEEAIIVAIAFGSEEEGVITEVATRFGKSHGYIRLLKHKLLKSLSEDLHQNKGDDSE